MKRRIHEDLKAAMKGGKGAEVSALRMLVAAIQNKEKEPGRAGELSDEEIQQVAAAEVKKRREAKEAFEKGGRQELAEKEAQEAALLQRYLPEQLSEEEVRLLVEEAVQETGAAGRQDMGKVMQRLMPKVKGRVDGALVSRLVAESLS